jgi:tripartite-type tricarboxylate transporter receptor subunit TctC
MLDRRTILSRAAAMAATADATLIASALGLATPARAQGGSPIAILVGFPPGGGPDFVARTLAQRMGSTLERPVIVDNRPGAGGRIALERLKNGHADGTSFVLTPSGMLQIYPFVFKNLTYEPATDFVPVCKVCDYHVAIVTKQEAPFKDIKEFVAWSKANPQKALYGVPGTGNAADFMGSLFAREAKVKLTPVVYKGGPQLTQAILSGEVPVAINLPSNFTELVKAGKLRLLAVSSSKRSPLTPAVPTLVEAGYPQALVEENMGIVAKAGTPLAAIERLQGAVAKALADAEVKKALLSLEYEPSFLGSQAYGELLSKGTARWKKIVSESGYKPTE